MDKFSYCVAQTKLQGAARSGNFNELERIIDRDPSFATVPPFRMPMLTNEINRPIDNNSAILLDSFGGKWTRKDRQPLAVSANGSCLFNAISVALTGNEDFAVELRVRCCIELVKNMQHYVLYHSGSTFPLVCPEYKNSALDCACSSGYSSAWTMHAAATVLRQQVPSIYPPVNGLLDTSFAILNCTFEPRSSSHMPQVVNEDLRIMWTGGLPRQGCIWVPNHFVPLASTNRCVDFWPQLPQTGNQSPLDSGPDPAFMRPMRNLRNRVTKIHEKKTRQTASQCNLTDDAPKVNRLIITSSCFSLLLIDLENGGRIIYGTFLMLSFFFSDHIHRQSLDNGANARRVQCPKLGTRPR